MVTIIFIILLLEMLLDSLKEIYRFSYVLICALIFLTASNALLKRIIESRFREGS
jgi:hypothetical protein